MATKVGIGTIYKSPSQGGKLKLYCYSFVVVVQIVDLLILQYGEVVSPWLPQFEANEGRATIAGLASDAQILNK